MQGAPLDAVFLIQARVDGDGREVALDQQLVKRNGLCSRMQFTVNMTPAQDPKQGIYRNIRDIQIYSNVFVYGVFCYFRRYLVGLGTHMDACGCIRMYTEA